MGDIVDKQMVIQLVTVLEDQIRVYRHLLDIVRKEKEILVAAHLDELNENNRAKEAMLIKIRSLETDRLKAAMAVHSDMKLAGNEPRLLDIARNLDPETGERLRSVHSVLELLLRRVQDYNRQNEALVQSALTNITGTMNALKGSLQEKAVYQKKGEVEGHTNAGHLVSREA